MKIKNTSQALTKTLAEASELAESLQKQIDQATETPVPLSELASEIERRMREYDVSITMLTEQSGVAKNTVMKALNDPYSMGVATLTKVIEPLGLSLCFKRQ